MGGESSRTYPRDLQSGNMTYPRRGRAPRIGTTSRFSARMRRIYLRVPRRVGSYVQSPLWAENWAEIPDICLFSISDIYLILATEDLLLGLRTYPQKLPSGSHDLKASYLEDC